VRKNNLRPANGVSSDHITLGETVTRIYSQQF